MSALNRFHQIRDRTPQLLNRLRLANVCVPPNLDHLCFRISIEQLILIPSISADIDPIHTHEMSPAMLPT